MLISYVEHKLNIVISCNFTCVADVVFISSSGIEIRNFNKRGIDMLENYEYTLIPVLHILDFYFCLNSRREVVKYLKKKKINLPKTI